MSASYISTRLEQKYCETLGTCKWYSVQVQIALFSTSQIIFCSITVQINTQHTFGFEITLMSFFPETHFSDKVNYPDYTKMVLITAVSKQ